MALVPAGSASSVVTDNVYKVTNMQSVEAPPINDGITCTGKHNSRKQYVFREHKLRQGHCTVEERRGGALCQVRIRRIGLGLKPYLVIFILIMLMLTEV